ncbi:MAG TPA: CerR family C-terminal domain-containing protein [Aquabacterium sp.]|nr:CerR family C-terminal domain-containing protein [Aquabacterium sp.]
MKINQALDFGSMPPDEAAPSKGERARERLIEVASRMFADKGFAKASTREICLAAGQNVAAIHYYFGDKAGLYRAVLERPLESMVAVFAEFDAPDLPLDQALRLFMSALLYPWGQEQAEWCLRLHLREMIEPTHEYKDVIAQHVLPLHTKLVELLARHVGARQVDDALHQLAFALAAMVHDYGMSREFMAVLAPSLLKGEGALDRVLTRLVGYGLALVEHERRQRQSN